MSVGQADSMACQDRIESPIPPCAPPHRPRSCATANDGSGMLTTRANLSTLPAHAGGDEDGPDL